MHRLYRVNHDGGRKRYNGLHKPIPRDSRKHLGLKRIGACRTFPSPAGEVEIARCEPPPFGPFEPTLLSVQHHAERPVISSVNHS